MFRTVPSCLDGNAAVPHHRQPGFGPRPSRSTATSRIVPGIGEGLILTSYLVGSAAIEPRLAGSLMTFRFRRELSGNAVSYVSGLQSRPCVSPNKKAPRGGSRKA